MVVYISAAILVSRGRHTDTAHLLTVEDGVNTVLPIVLPF